MTPAATRREIAAPGRGRRPRLRRDRGGARRRPVGRRGHRRPARSTRSPPARRRWRPSRRTCGWSSTTGRPRARRSREGRGAPERRATQQLDVAAANGVPAARSARSARGGRRTRRPLQGRRRGPPDGVLVRGPGSPSTSRPSSSGRTAFPIVLDRTTKTVYRVDLRAKKATAVVRAGPASRGTKVGDPKPSSRRAARTCWSSTRRTSCGAGGRRTPRARGRWPASGSPSQRTWGATSSAIGTYVRNAEDGLYNLYVIDPSEQQILRYTPARTAAATRASGPGT